MYDNCVPYTLSVSMYACMYVGGRGNRNRWGVLGRKRGSSAGAID